MTSQIPANPSISFCDVRLVGMVGAINRNGDRGVTEVHVRVKNRRGETVRVVVEAPIDAQVAVGEAVRALGEIGPGGVICCTAPYAEFVSAGVLRSEPLPAEPQNGERVVSVPRTAPTASAPTQEVAPAPVPEVSAPAAERPSASAPVTASPPPRAAAPSPPPSPPRPLAPRAALPMPPLPPRAAAPVTRAPGPVTVPPVMAATTQAVPAKPQVTGTPAGLGNRPPPPPPPPATRPPLPTTAPKAPPQPPAPPGSMAALRQRAATVSGPNAAESHEDPGSPPHHEEGHPSDVGNSPPTVPTQRPRPDETDMKIPF